jgi:23S rRNA (uracil1939-C5)-methyltransferase
MHMGPDMDMNMDMNMDMEGTSMTRNTDSRERAPAERAERIEVAIESLATGGDGVGRDDQGRVVFVPGSAPGDRVRVRVVERKKRFARGEIIELLEPAAGRVAPPCPLFAKSTCGGCQWQHLDIAVQRRTKAEIVARELRKQIAAGMEVRPIAGDVPAYQWRRRARFQYLKPRGAQAAIIGFYAPRSHRVTDVPACPQLEPALHDALRALREVLAVHLGSRGEISMVAAVAPAGSPASVHVAIRGWCAPKHAARLVGKGGDAGTIVGVVLHGPPAQRGNAQPKEWGEALIEIEPGLLGRADRFAQASAAGNRALVEAVDQACGPRAGKRVVEFYAGAGNFTRVLERDAAEVVACDSAAVPWRPGIRVGVAHEVARALVDEGQRFDLAVLDPPRTGARELVEVVAGLAPERIVYVSCDPATLARDIEVLEGAGYRAESAQPLDLMPQTAHVEVVVTLSLVPGRAPDLQSP